MPAVELSQPKRIMNDRPSLVSLPYELVWKIVDFLLASNGSIFNVGRFALTSTSTAILLGDDRAWRARCQRQFGYARTVAHKHTERFGIRWLHLYVAMANELASPEGTARVGRRTWGTLYMSNLVYWGQIAGGQPHGYGVYVTCDSMGRTLITEAALDDGGRRSGWIAVTSTKRFYGMRRGPPHDNPETHCMCPVCVGQYPGLTSRLGPSMTGYDGDWDGGRIQGNGNATFVGGLDYDGQWADGVPHGEGALNGQPHRWYRGLPVAPGQWTGSEHGAVGDGIWTYEGDILLGTSNTDTDPVRRWREMACIRDDRPVDASATRPVSDYGPVPHGHGRAMHEGGRVYTGTWRMGVREHGQCALPDGTILDGVWYAEYRPERRGSGWWTGPGAASRAAAVWGQRDGPCLDADPRGSRYNRADVHVAIILPVGRRRRGMDVGSGGGLDCAHPKNSMQWLPMVMTYGNGDKCMVMSNLSERTCGIVRFDCSTYCPDPEFSGLTIISEAGWSPLPFQHEHFVSAVYWPNDPDSDAFARFVAYVRKGYIGWTSAQVDAFWAAMAHLGVAAPAVRADDESRS
nr:phosphatidylinositol phosphate kinase motif-containing protein [Pandoravirus massiliensis]